MSTNVLLYKAKHQNMLIVSSVIKEVGRVPKNCTSKKYLEIFTQVKVIVWIVSWVRVKIVVSGCNNKIYKKYFLIALYIIPIFEKTIFK